MKLRDFYLLQQKVDSLQSEADRLEGSRIQLLKQLKSEHGCKTVEEAETLLARLTKEQGKLEREAEKALNKFEQEYHDRLSTQG